MFLQLLFLLSCVMSCIASETSWGTNSAASTPKKHRIHIKIGRSHNRDFVFEDNRNFVEENCIKLNIDQASTTDNLNTYLNENKGQGTLYIKNHTRLRKGNTTETIALNKIPKKIVDIAFVPVLSTYTAHTMEKLRTELEYDSVYDMEFRFVLRN
jgi:hypothetical protein